MEKNIKESEGIDRMVEIVEEVTRMLTKCEQETIINFNKEEKVAYIFTYEKTWQQHLEKKLGLKPSLVNGFGGKGYEIGKSRIRKPIALKNLTAGEKKKRAETLAQYRFLAKNNR
jgi:hypothetical protein